MLFDWLVVAQILATNPASSVRGPKPIDSVQKRACFICCHDRCLAFSDRILALQNEQ